MNVPRDVSYRVGLHLNPPEPAAIGRDIAVWY